MSEFDEKNLPVSNETRHQLREVRHSLLKLHKSILDVERAAYERIHGRIESPQALLQLVMRNPWFGWFRPLSEIVVRIDEILDSTEPVPEAEAQNILRELRSLLQPAEEGEEFGVKYQKILQEDAGVILNHAEISRLLDPST